MRFLSNLFSARRAPTFDAPLAPDHPFVAIGDIHGAAPLLESLLGRIEADYPDIPIVCVGDLVDRGEDSATVLRRVHALCTGSRRVYCLMGNHERMMLDFLDDPEKNGPRWLRYGGLQTLASFKVSYRGPQDLAHAADALEAALGTGLLEWLRALPTSWQSGNVAVVHAGANPAKPMSDQSEAALLWGHPEFGKTPRTDGVWVVHGHTIVEGAVTENGLISVDTGAYASGVLTAALIGVDGVTFMST